MSHCWKSQHLSIILDHAALLLAKPFSTLPFIQSPGKGSTGTAELQDVEPGGSANYLFTLTAEQQAGSQAPQKALTGALGKLEVRWRSNSAAMGRLQTQQIMASSAAQKDIALSLCSLPQVVLGFPRARTSITGLSNATDVGRHLKALASASIAWLRERYLLHSSGAPTQHFNLHVLNAQEVCLEQPFTAQLQLHNVSSSSVDSLALSLPAEEIPGFGMRLMVGAHSHNMRLQSPEDIQSLACGLQAVHLDVTTPQPPNPSLSLNYAVNGCPQVPF